MNPERNLDILKLYSQAIFIKGVKDAEQFLENNLPIDGDQKDRQLAKVLAEEKKFEDNRKRIEELMKEREELTAELANCDEESVKKLTAERDELLRKRQEENDTTITSQKAIDEILRMKKEIEKMRASIETIKRENIHLSSARPC